MKKFLFLLLLLFIFICAGHFAPHKLMPPEINSEKPIQEILVASLDDCLFAMTQADPDVGTGTKATVGSCTTSSVTCSSTISGTLGIAAYATQVYRATPFTGDGSTICGVKIPLYVVDQAADYTLRVRVWTDSTGPAAAYSVESGDVEASTITETTESGAVANPTTFSWGTPFVITNAVTYYLVVYSPDGDQPNDEYIGWVRTNYCSPEGLYYDDDGSESSPSDWTSDLSSSGIFELLKQ